jgi:hypothetical protein
MSGFSDGLVARTYFSSMLKTIELLPWFPHALTPSGLLRETFEKNGIAVVKDSWVDYALLTDVDHHERRRHGKPRRTLFYNPHPPEGQKILALGHEFIHYVMDLTGDSRLVSVDDQEWVAGVLSKRFLCPFSEMVVRRALGSLSVDSLCEACPQELEVLDSEKESMAKEMIDSYLSGFPVIKSVAPRFVFDLWWRVLERYRPFGRSHPFFHYLRN